MSAQRWSASRNAERRRNTCPVRGDLATHARVICAALERRERERLRETVVTEVSGGACEERLVLRACNGVSDPGSRQSEQLRKGTEHQEVWVEQRKGRPVVRFVLDETEVGLIEHHGNVARL